MGCGSHSKVNTVTVSQSKQAETQIHDIKQIIDQNLKEIQYKKPQMIIEELEKEENNNKQQQLDIQNKDKYSHASDGSVKNSSLKSSPKTTSATISSKQDILLTQAIAKHTNVFYTEILQKEVFKLGANLKKHIHVGQFNRNQNQAKRIQSEIRILVKNLPIYQTNSIFVRCNEVDTNHFQCVIMGSKDTPYAYGAYVYDLYCDYSFPSSPPKMKLLTTGGGQIRFNPNLYRDGFICLSLLGTWSGQKNEKWNEQTSNILQLLLSIQSLVMNEGVYYNEPSVGKPNPENEQKNRAYKNIIKIANIKYAMIDQLRNPDPVFRDIIKMHFYLNKNEILKECDEWIIDAKLSDANNTKYESFVKSHNTNQATRYKGDYSLYSKDLIDIVYELKQELQKIDISTLPLYQEFLEKINVSSSVEAPKSPSIQADIKEDLPNVINIAEERISQHGENVIDKLPHLNELVC